MNKGDFVYEVDTRRKAEIISVENFRGFSDAPDLVIIRECKSGKEIETTWQWLRSWPIKPKQEQVTA